MGTFQQWASDVCGLAFKVIKDKPAAKRQESIGFWWDSHDLTP